MRRHTFVIRVQQDDIGQIWGQILYPVTGERITFAGVDELWERLRASLHLLEPFPTPDGHPSGDGSSTEPSPNPPPSSDEAS